MASWDFLQRFFPKERSSPNLSTHMYLFVGCAFLFHSQPLFALVQPGCCLSSRYETRAGWQTQRDDKPAALESCSAVEITNICPLTDSGRSAICPLAFQYFLLCLFLPGAAPYLMFISKLKCLQVTLLPASSEAKPKCSSGCQELLHKSMVHSRSESSWVIEHCSAAAVEHGTSYLKKTPMSVITDLILITHQYAHPFISKYPESLHAKWSTQKKILQKDFAGLFGSLGNLQNHYHLTGFHSYF